jgi:integrase/recombinase XerD
VADLVKPKPFCSSVLIKLLFKSAVVRCRMAASYLGIILSDFIVDLHKRGYSPEGVRHHVLVAEHFGYWLKRRGVRLHQLSTLHVREFLSFHLPRCHCPQPARKVREDCRAPLRRLVEFLRRRNGIRESVTKSVPQSPVDRLIAAYDRHMERACGLSVEVRRRRQLCARQFLKWRFGGRAPQMSQLQAKQVRSFVLSRARQLGPTGIRALVVSLRSFLKFLEFSGRLRSGLAGFIPQPVDPLPPPPPQILEPEQRRKLLNSFQKSTPKGRRDYTMVLCLAELALRSQEVASLTLDDLDWRAMTLRLAHTKQQRQRLLPLPESVAKAILSYLKHGRPVTESRVLFVHHYPPAGQPLTAHAVRVVVRRAFARCGIPASGSYILRHTWATRAHRQGAGLKLIADLLGHRSLESTTRYAHVNLEELRQAALPWPKIKP